MKAKSNVLSAPPEGGVAKAFRTLAAVNEALRALLKMSEATERSGR
jgi:hypothetical protein